MKRIEVVDACGVFMHNTYERRARGLVKKGRAQFLTASKICLRPLPEKLEDWMMETIQKEEVLNRIDQILHQKQHLQEAFSAIEKIPQDLDEHTCELRTRAIYEIVEAREKTNREVLALLQAMLDKSAVQTD